jgi:hypothetical protein
MIRKRSFLTCLLGLNGLLAAVFLIGSLTSRPAIAQVGGGPGDTLCVTGKAGGQTYDVVYLLDVPSRKLHAFYPSSPQNRQLAYGGFRDLEKDLPRRP